MHPIFQLVKCTAISMIILLPQIQPLVSSLNEPADHKVDPTYLNLSSVIHLCKPSIQCSKSRVVHLKIYFIRL